MRKIILVMPVPVNAFTERPGPQPDWHKAGDELHCRLNEQVGAMRRAKCRAVGLFMLGLGSLCGDLPSP